MRVFDRNAVTPTLALLLLSMPILLGCPARASPQTSPQSGEFDGPAELPRIYVESSLGATPAPGRTLSVRAGEDPSRVLSKASCGDTVELQAGTTFGTLLLPQKNCDDSHWIIVRTSAPDSKLPPEGTRLTPCYAGISALAGRPDLHCGSSDNALAKIEFTGKGGSGPVAFAAGANHYRLLGLEITRAASDGCISAVDTRYCPRRDRARNHVGAEPVSRDCRLLLQRLSLRGQNRCVHRCASNLWRPWR